jgi:hypothetical protein
MKQRSLWKNDKEITTSENVAGEESIGPSFERLGR